MVRSWDAQGSYEPTTTQAQELLREFSESGLLFLANESALHRHGYALGTQKDSAGNITGLVLLRSDDPEGIWFDEETVRMGRQKLLASGHLRGVPSQ